MAPRVLPLYFTVSRKLSIKSYILHAFIYQMYLCIYTFDKEPLICSNYRCVNLYYCRYVLQLRDPQMFNQGLDLMMVLSTPFNRIPADSFLLKSSCIVWSVMTWFNDFTPAWHCMYHQIIMLPHIKHSSSPSLKCSF